jgi:hypothetical protein
MQRLRLLVVLLTALAVAFTGTSIASADDYKKKSRTGPDVISVSDVYANGKHPERVYVEIRYRCDSRSEKGTLEVLLRQRAFDPDGSWKHAKARYDGEAKADCDGKRHRQWVTLKRDDDRKNSGYVHDGRAHLDVTLSEKRGDHVEETFPVRVKGAGDHSKDKYKG